MNYNKRFLSGFVMRHLPFYQPLKKSLVGLLLAMLVVPHCAMAMQAAAFSYTESTDMPCHLANAAQEQTQILCAQQCEQTNLISAFVKYAVNKPVLDIQWLALLPLDIIHNLALTREYTPQLWSPDSAASVLPSTDLYLNTLRLRL